MRNVPKYKCMRVEFGNLWISMGVRKLRLKPTLMDIYGGTEELASCQGLILRLSYLDFYIILSFKAQAGKQRSAVGARSLGEVEKSFFM